MTTGRVASSEIKGPAPARDGQRGGGRSGYTVHVHHTYAVDGTQYSNVWSTRIQAFHREADAREFLRRLVNEDHTVSVYYDPSDPGEWVLVPGYVSSAAYPTVVMGLVFLGVAAFQFRRQGKARSTTAR